jgi:hypothetical protein
VSDDRHAREAEAQRRRTARLRAEVEAGERDVPHGEYGYTRYGCRCRTCTAGNTAGQAKRRAERRQR